MSDAAVDAPDVSRSGLSAVPAGLSAAGLAIPAALLVSLPGLVFVAGSDHLAYGAGLLGGIVLAGLLVAPRIAAAGATGIWDALHRRFGKGASLPAAVVVALAALPLLVVEFSLLGRVAEGMLGVSDAPAVFIAFVAVALVATAASARAFAWLSALACALVAASLLVPLALLAAHDPGTLWPHVAHADALDRIRALEETLIEAGRVDFETFAAHATPFGRLDRANVLGLIAALALGMAVMPPLIAHLAAPQRARARGLAGAWTAFFVMLLLLAAPLLAACAKLAIYAAMAADTPLANLPSWLEAPLTAGVARIHGTSVAILTEVARTVAAGATDAAGVAAHLAIGAPSLETRWLALAAEVQEAIVTAAQSLAAAPHAASAWDLYQSLVVPAAARAAASEAPVLTQAALSMDPLGLWLALPALAGAPHILTPLMAAGALLAALVMMAALARVLLALGQGEDAGHGSGGSWPHVVPALAATAIAAALAALLRPGDLAPMVVASLSLLAAGLFPVLAVGLAWRRTTATAAAVSIVLGAGVSLYYDVGIQAFPAAFYETWPGLSNAGEYAIEEFVARREAVATAADATARAAAQTALDDWARGTPTRPGLANWLGIESASGAVFGVPAGLAALVLISLATARRRRA